MMTDAADFVFAGWFVVRPWQRPEGHGLPELSRQVLTITKCGHTLLPDDWSWGWEQPPSPARAAASAAEFGIEAARVPELRELVNQAYSAGTLAWPRYVLSQQVIGAVRAFLPPGSDARVLGVGLAAAHVDELLSVFDGERQPAPNVAGRLAARAVFPDGGRALGFELLVCDAWSVSGHSWLCNGLDGTLWNQRGIRTNAWGLLDDPAVATSWAEQITREELGEPGRWFPWLLADYTEMLPPVTQR